MSEVIDALASAIGSAVRLAAGRIWENLEGLLLQIPNLLAAIIVVLVFVALARLARRVLTGLGRLSRLDPTLQELLQRLAAVAVITLGVGIGLSVLGLDPATLIASLGIAGLIVGFALKDLLENFIAGVLILWRQPIRVGDLIRVGPNEGVVQEISFRTSSLRALDGTEVLIPNAQIFTQAVHNYSRFGTRRTTIVLTVPDDADLERLLPDLRAAAARTEGVLDRPPPEALLLGTGNDGHQVHLRYWTRADAATIQAIESTVRRSARSLLAGAAEAGVRPPGDG